METKKENKSCEEIKAELIKSIQEMNYEEIRLFSIDLDVEISETEFDELKANYFNKFKNTDLWQNSGLFHIDNKNLKALVKENTGLSYIYFYFIKDGLRNTLALKFSDRLDLQYDYSTTSGEKIYLLNSSEQLTEISGNELENLSEAYQREFQNTVYERTGRNPTIYVFTEIKRLKEIGFLDSYITLHIVLEKNNKINLATQINSSVSRPGVRTFYNKGGLWP